MINNRTWLAFANKKGADMLMPFIPRIHQLENDITYKLEFTKINITPTPLCHRFPKSYYCRLCR